MDCTSVVTVSRNILLIGQTGSGKSTICNNILKDALTSSSDEGTAVVTQATGHFTSKSGKDMRYEVVVYDTQQIMLPNSSRAGLSNDLSIRQQASINESAVTDMKKYIEKNKINMHLIIFVLKSIDDEHGNLVLSDEDLLSFKKLMRLFNSSEHQYVQKISALALTHCDLLHQPSNKKKIAMEFHKLVKAEDITGFMKKGIFPVSFPHQNSNGKIIPALSDSDDDRHDLLKLIEEANWPVYWKDIFIEPQNVPQHQPTQPSTGICSVM